MNVLNAYNCSNVNLAEIMLIIIRIIKLLHIMVPIGLIIVGSLVFAKGAISSEDQFPLIWRGFFNKIVAAISIFLVVPLVSFTINLTLNSTDSGSEGGIASCARLAVSRFTDLEEGSKNLEGDVKNKGLKRIYEKNCENKGQKYIGISKNLYDYSLSNASGFLEQNDMIYVCVEGEV